jgi:hypothetical protein
MRKLVDKTIGSVVGVGRSWALLICSLRRLRSLVVGSRRLLGVRRWIWVVHEVARGSKACGVWLLLLRTLCLGLLTTALCLSREYWVREGGRGSWVGSIRKCGTVIIQVQVEPVAIVIAVHLVCRCRSLPTDFERKVEGSCRLRAPIAFPSWG